MQLNSGTTVVLGMGNLIRSDDGVGVHVVQRLEADCRVPPDVLLLDGGTLGLALLSRIGGAQRLLVIDAVDSGSPAGTLVRLEGKELRGMPGNGSVHQLGFADLLSALSIIGEEPEELVVFGIQPGSTELGTALSPAVAALLDHVVETAITQLATWSQAAGRGKTRGTVAAGRDATCTN